MYASVNWHSPVVWPLEYMTSGEGKLAGQNLRQRKWKEIARLGAGGKILVECSPGSVTKKGRLGGNEPEKPSSTKKMKGGNEQNQPFGDAGSLSQSSSRCVDGMWKGL